MRILDLESLDIFRAVVQAGGVVRAATRLNRVQSNVTTRIKQLEARLGVRLFQRQGRSLVLTPSGQTLLTHAEHLLRTADDVESAMRLSAANETLRIGSMESTAGSRLPQVLTRLHQQHPQVRIELQTGTTAAMTRMVQQYELDLAFVGEPFSVKGLQAKPVFEEELILITHRSHPPVTEATDLEMQTLLAFAAGCSYRKRLEDWLAMSGVHAEQVLELSSYQAIIACAAAGAGCALVPASLLNALQAQHDVRCHRLPDKVRLNRTHIIWKSAPSSAVEKLFALLPSETAGSKAEH